MVLEGKEDAEEEGKPGRRRRALLERGLLPPTPLALRLLDRASVPPLPPPVLRPKPAAADATLVANGGPSRKGFARGERDDERGGGTTEATGGRLFSDVPSLPWR